ncbi:class I SAM-dependent methyltransferase [Streptosporangium fragile]|uniref:Class I SAM-dependent methyltransferase n=1 Tax=Streptosporangium fragile TaxID=46186 RepID=A0ABP6I7Y6_9ACTN
MNGHPLTPRALMSLLANGAKAMDVVETALELGVLDVLESAEVTVAELGTRLGLVPSRLYKMLDCLESLGFVRSRSTGDDPFLTRYTAVAGLREAALAVAGPDALERDRDRYPWRVLYGSLPEVLRGTLSIPADDFGWPPDETQLAGFERSMAAGLGPFIETFRSHTPRLFGASAFRLLDVGGGDGTLAAALLPCSPELRVDVFNLPAAEPLVERTRRDSGQEDRLGFVVGDFLRGPLPRGYDGMSLVRVLHDWPVSTARTLLRKVHEALKPGGRVMICEEFRTPERLAGQFFWSYFLMGVDACHSRLYDIEHYTRLLGETGFVEITVLPGPVEVILASRGGSRGEEAGDGPAT